MFYHTLPYSQQVFLCDIKKGKAKKKEMGRKRQECLAMAFKLLRMLCSRSGKPVMFQCLAAPAGEAQTCMEGGWLSQTESFPEMPDASPKPFQTEE